MTLKRNGERLRENISIYDTRLCVGEFAKKRYARENGISQLVVDKPRGFREERGSERYSKLVSVNSKSIYQSPRSCVRSRSAKFEIRDVSPWLIIRDSNCVVLDMFSLRLSFFFVFTTCDNCAYKREKSKLFYATNLQNHADWRVLIKFTRA